MSLDEQTELFQLAAFGSIDGIGRRTLRKVLRYRSERGWSWQDLWVPNPEMIAFLSLSTKQVESIKKTQYEQVSTAIIQGGKNHELRLIGTEDEEYPPLLKEADDPPPVLYVKGAKLDWLEAQHIPIAIVGTRNMTAYGRTATEKITVELVNLGAVIVSGLMYGVDTVAHLSAVRSEGTSVAVLGYGFDHCYPPEHKPILDELLHRGATFISEYPPWKIAKKGNFPARNSIVAGMSAAVVVTEAAAKSGSMITAQFAVEEGRAVCAVPGPITNPYCEGTKWLINEGATLVSSGAEVLEQIYRPCMANRYRVATMSCAQPERRLSDCFQLSSIAEKVRTVLLQGPADLEGIAITSGVVDQKELLSALTELELLALITCVNGRWSLVSF